MHRSTSNPSHTSSSPPSPSSSPSTVLPEVIVAGVRLDEYHPTLNTGLSDVRIQNAILETPMVRALLVPECDMEARRRCMTLLSKILLAAIPVLHTINNASSLNGVTSNNNNTNSTGQTDKAKGLLEQHSVVTSMIAKTNPSNLLVLFWLAHHLQNLERELGVVCPSLPLPKRDADLAATVSPTLAQLSTPHLYARLQHLKTVVQDLADRVQGAVCIVFWESWDESYELVAELVGSATIAEIEKGRIFRHAGNAATYISRKKVQLRELERSKLRLEKKTRKKSVPVSPPDSLYFEPLQKFRINVHDNPHLSQMEDDNDLIVVGQNATNDNINNNDNNNHSNGHGSATDNHPDIDASWPFRLSDAPPESDNKETNAADFTSLIDSSELEDLISKDFDESLHAQHPETADFESVLQDLRQNSPLVHTSGKAFIASALSKPPAVAGTAPGSAPHKRVNEVSDEFSYLRKRIRLLEEMEDQEEKQSMPANSNNAKSQMPTPPGTASSLSGPQSLTPTSTSSSSTTTSSSTQPPPRRASSVSDKAIWDQLQMSSSATSSTTVKVPMKMQHATGVNLHNLPLFSSGQQDDDDHVLDFGNKMVW